SDMLLSDPDLSAYGRRSLERIQRAARDMEAVIDAFLILAREGGIAPVSEEFEVRDVVLEEVEKARPLLGDKPVALAVSGEASPRMFAPPAVLGVVLRKLLVNACHFTERGNIDVRIEPDAVTVADTGIGMSPDTLRPVFEPLYRADALRPLGQGFGLTSASRSARRIGSARRPDRQGVRLDHRQPPGAALRLGTAARQRAGAGHRRDPAVRAHAGGLSRPGARAPPVNLRPAGALACPDAPRPRIPEHAPSPVPP